MSDIKSESVLSYASYQDMETLTMFSNVRHIIESCTILPLNFSIDVLGKNALTVQTEIPDALGQGRQVAIIEWRVTALLAPEVANQLPNKENAFQLANMNHFIFTSYTAVKASQEHIESSDGDPRGSETRQTCLPIIE